MAGKIPKITKEIEDQIVQLYLSGQSIYKIAPVVGVSVTSCLRVLIRKKIPRNNFITHPEIEKKVVDLYNQGFTYEKIGQTLSIKWGVCHKILKRNGLKGRTRDKYAPAHQEYSRDNDFFKTIDTEEKAYWLGFISADGNVSKNLLMLTIRLASKDKEHLQKFLNSIKSDNKIRSSIGKCRGKFFKNNSIHISCKKMCEDLVKLGVVPAKSLILKPWQGPPELMRHYWRGLIDGDGCISRYKDGNGIITLSGTKEICDGLRDYADNLLSIKDTTVGLMNNNDFSKHLIYRISYSNQKCIQLSKELYFGSNVYLERKYQRAISLINQTPNLWINY